MPVTHMLAVRGETNKNQYELLHCRLPVQALTNEAEHAVRPKKLVCTSTFANASHCCVFLQMWNNRNGEWIYFDTKPNFASLGYFLSGYIVAQCQLFWIQWHAPHLLQASLLSLLSLSSSAWPFTLLKVPIIFKQKPLPSFTTNTFKTSSTCHIHISRSRNRSVWWWRQAWGLPSDLLLIRWNNKVAIMIHNLRKWSRFLSSWCPTFTD